MSVKIETKSFKTKLLLTLFTLHWGSCQEKWFDAHISLSVSKFDITSRANHVIQSEIRRVVSGDSEISTLFEIN